LQACSGGFVGDPKGVEGFDGVAVLAAEDPEEDVLGAQGWLSELLGLFSGELDRPPGFTGDENPWSTARGVEVDFVGEVTVFSVGCLLTDPQCSGDLRP
jgi:hypothetical protein